ncbi:phosphate starvation-inducible protein PhoH [Corynebacterium sp. 13CS0277]|uniref:PhoH family protein n=1 Tax=Corynebacterium sp. 13CS0277 TaxID=2071994 RepID=UPI000D02A602|nr:PhoH family protein [Corynebacterium sp. 13CS0277]PRQ10894.1 phosphate starvation-inducible protein PhoH [Corynebacterium sp. 13CS0277]
MGDTAAADSALPLTTDTVGTAAAGGARVTHTVQLAPEYAQQVLGINDDSVKVLHNLTGVELFARGSDVTLIGQDFAVAQVQRALKELESMARRDHVITRDTVKHTVNMVAQKQRESVAGMLSQEIISRKGKVVRPKTLGQKQYVDAIDENTITFGLGPAGSGKTYLAMAKAVQALHAKDVSRIILTRPAVEAGEKLGFLPGTLNEKIDPYLRPLHDALRDMVEPEMIPKLMEAGIVEVAPLAYMRGRTLNDAFVILDEAQNTTPAQMKMFLTRLGFGSKMVVTGDITQVDLPGGQKSGLRIVREILAGVRGISFQELTSEDVVRHQLVGAIVDAYDEWDDRQESLAAARRAAREAAAQSGE